MKINLNKQNKRKAVFDILNIFYKKDEIIFTDLDYDIQVGDDFISFENKKYPYKDSQDMKKNLYKISENYTGYSSPWGTLTGSKPSKLLKKYNTKQLKEKYLINDEKIKILNEVKKTQDSLAFDKKAINLYINIPFCPSRCAYCSYPTIIKDENKSFYVEKNIEEIKGLKLPQNLDTIYIGGGTPSHLDHRDLERLLSFLNERFSFNEFTLEAGRVDTLDRKKLDMAKANNVNRISLNPQTFSEKVIKFTNRYYDMEKFLNLYDYAKSLGFIVNMDFIVGLYGENRQSFLYNFEILKELLPTNITFHALARKIGSKYFENNISGSNIESLKISEDIWEFSKKYSYKAYYLYRQKNIISNLENVGFERENTASRYNILINEELENIVGIGMNSNSKFVFGDKYRNGKNLRDYYKKLDEEISEKNKLLEKLADFS